MQMPFSANHTMNRIYRFFIIRKEFMDFSLTNHKPNLNFNQKYQAKKASASTSVNGSVTIEAAFILPLFFFALICLLSLFEMEAVNLMVRNGLQSVGQEIAYKDCSTIVYVSATTGTDVVQTIGEERLERSWIQNGSAGISCGKSYRNPITHEYTFIAEYKIEMPFSTFGIPPVQQRIRLQMKGWNGYQSGGQTDGAGENQEMVYITDDGTVYHRNPDCTYLNLSIHSTTLGAVGNERNRYQETYKACELCGSGAAGTVYITDTGNRYHSNRNCSGLKRTVHNVSIEEAGERSACSRCG
jgi:hypothetical protein